jgi:hypothetical protein
MKLKPRKINSFLLFKLPSAFFCGVRLKSITKEEAVVTVKHRWINQNPFNSMYFAVQAMAAELSTGALVMQAIQASNENISMLVAENKSSFSKKAKGKITFLCGGGIDIAEAIQKAIQKNEGQECWMHAIGKDESNDVVSSFSFKWTVKKR